jgi:hypothetical protein
LWSGMWLLKIERFPRPDAAEAAHCSYFSVPKTGALSIELLGHAALV